MTAQYTNHSYYQALADAGHNITKVATADILALYARIDELEAMVTNLNEGAKIMHAFATGGESKLLADWKDEPISTPKPRIIVSQSWLDKHTNNGIDDLKPTFGKIDIIGGTRNK